VGGSPPSALRLAPGTLWPRVLAREERARSRGALLPIPTQSEAIEDAGVRFVVRRAEAPDAAARPAAAAGQDPFLPFDPDLFVADVSDSHVCLLNKFSVLSHHLLIVTRRYEDQEGPLTPEDFEALFACAAELDALAFYNAGPVAGASQPHRHLQLVPVPLGDGPARTPMDAVLGQADLDGRLGRARGLPFDHAIANIADLVARPPASAANAVWEIYRDLLRALDLAEGRRPYNLLATRSRLWMVPRERERWESISVNALGFAGALLVQTAEQLGRLRAFGPMRALRDVARPRSRARTG
jgi:sulfate adenylyltransferase (ADP) / ATP adenylyltransferase